MYTPVNPSFFYISKHRRVYCAFNIFHKIFLPLGALHRRSKFANFCHDLIKTICRNYLSTKNVCSSHWCLKNQIYSPFPIVKMNANYAEICRVGRFSTRSTCSIFVQFSHYCCETSIIQIQQRKIKIIFYDKKSKTKSL